MFKKLSSARKLLRLIRGMVLRTGNETASTSEQLVSYAHTKIPEKSLDPPSFNTRPRIYTEPIPQRHGLP